MSPPVSLEEEAQRAMEEESSSLITDPNPATSREEDMGRDGGGEESPDFECNNTLNQPLLKRSPTLTSSHLAMVGAKVSHIESLDYEYAYLSLLMTM